ncbi:30S ribosomal protein S21 [Candidatus Shapirobacteria bacterium CG07_land_8_20_14_0_80_39_18]|uniref:Small ribosomal subunit protein bS21 n=1 Tax=Candidatus Shapirobacteria bacterium CG07_land_8_20_14_0_80_39_18 TaxID=1974882 RepID=A0A2M6YRI0_9BACT|nr:30S ribosomal protein S21 [Candidatus Microgenomates bacterium]PIU35336.1 MAG: 30S ribosomal protein S21 [Candidatus Shapirobacteria bacterium CG07_land_8_20_14_0_80_39_18]
MATIVKKQLGQTEDQLIAQFRKKVLNDDILGELKKREFYIKPSRARYEKMKRVKKGKR